ncbi:MAG: signal peptidase I [Candidatus Omnitrophica bacterium]|nr:signal peptidase I [Candidatus Omnitrophota bacterium]
MKFKKPSLQKVKAFLKDILVALALAIFIKTFFLQAYKIPSGSMIPTLKPGDLILVEKITYGAKVPFTEFRLPGLRRPKRADVIVFIAPHEPKKAFIKRLVALPGEVVEIKKGTIYINDLPLLEEIFSSRYYYNRGEFAQEGDKVSVPKDSFFVLGDNSSSSQDSRYWGFVPYKNLIGRALLIYWPPWRIRLIK